MPGSISPSRRARLTVAAVLVSIAGAAVSAHAMLADAGVPAPAALPKATGYEADAHFPGAALLYAQEPPPAPAPIAAQADQLIAGVTGTAPLPDLPIPANAVIDDTIRPAKPFVLTGAAADQARALQCLTTAIYYEAASEPDDGQAAVAQVILNRVRHPAFPNSVCGVVYQGSDRRGCQFSFACDGAMARVPMQSAWVRARRAAALALAGKVFAPVGLATHYHTYAVRPYWAPSLVMTGAFGAHFFHRWKGYWGTAGAFAQRYAGFEPAAQPKPRTDLVAPVATAALSPLAPGLVAAVTTPTGVPLATTAPAEIQPEHARSGDALPQYAAATADDQILDKWKDSGKPLR